MRTVLRALVIGVVGIPILLVGAVAAAYFVDRAVSEGEVMRNVTFEGRSVGGLGRADLTATVDRLGEERIAAPITVELPGLTISALARDLGVDFDAESVITGAMAVGRGDGLRNDFRAWWKSWFEDEELSLGLELDADVARAFADVHPDRVHRVPIEPHFTGANGGFEGQPPVTGQYLDGALVVGALQQALGVSRPPESVEVAWGIVPTDISQAEYDAALAEAERLAARLTVVVNDRPAFIGSESVRRWIDSSVVDGEMVPVFAPERVEQSVERLLAPLSTETEAPTFAVLDGEVVFELGLPAYACCAPDAGITDMLFEAALNGGRGAVELPVRLVEPDAGEARARRLGITEVVGEFTTRHACCRNRVDNIHRIADLVRGQIVAPGETFSINDFIGRRTREKGFVAAGTISQGHFVDDVGGGISQFATTMFNAAFFAGLDFEAYRAHSIYISRYPYGREATLSFPQPDLAITNNTPYGVLLWTSYTSTSITVEIYSTPYWDVEQTGQTTFRVGACTGVNTFRTRTAPDGTVLEDRVTATYRPGEGIDCNGRAIPRP